MIALTFLGAARHGDGSKYLLDCNGHAGPGRLRPVSGAEGAAAAQLAGSAGSTSGSIDAVVLTHAHLDHCGYLPRLVRAGIPRTGVLHARARRICAARAARLRPHPGRGRRQANRHGYSKHRPALPLYTRGRRAPRAHAAAAVGYDRPVPLAPGIEVEFINAGHLLGSSYARMHVDGRTMLFGGDLGRYGRPGAAGSDARRTRPTSCSSNRPTAIASTSRTTTARGWRRW